MTRASLATMAFVFSLAATAGATPADGSCPVDGDSPVAALSGSVRSAKKVSDRTWRKHVADAVHTTDGIWGPSKDGMKKVKPGDLNACLTNVYKGAKALDGSADVWTMKVDGRSIYLFEAQGDGFTSYDLRSASCKKLKMGDKKHDPVALPFPAEADPLPARSTWIKNLKESMRHVTAMGDTPVITGDAIPDAVKKEIAERVEKWGKDEYGTFEVKTEVHHVRLQGRDSYLVYFDLLDGVANVMFEPNGKELDVDF